MRAIHVAVALATVALAACGKQQEAARPPAAGPAGKTGGMQMAMQGMQMMPLMRAHLDSLGAVPPEQMAARMGAHQELASRMMDAMGVDMRGMHMKPDSTWAMLSDSVRQDLAALPGLSGAALTARIQAHIERMQRMMAMHEGMMKM